MDLDPTLFPIVNVLAPVLAMIAVCSTVVGFFWVGKHYKLREKELELEAQLHGRQLEAQLRAMDVRLAGVENVVLGRPQQPVSAGDRAALIAPAPQLKERG